MRLFIILIIAVYVFPAMAFELNKGVAVNDNNVDDLAYGSMEYAIADFVLKKDDPGTVVGFYRVEGKDDLYSLSSGSNLYHTIFPNRTAKAVWPLTRWPQEYREPEILARLEERNYPDELTVSGGGDSLGCLGDTPLRYGDVNQDGKPELVVFLTNHLVFFSPEQGNTIFSTALSVEDWYGTEKTLEHFSYVGAAPSDTDPQYQSRIFAQTSRGGGRQRGYRGYGKLYFGDFDQNDTQDLILWRKLYLSRLRGDETPGFEHLRDTLIHYRFTEGQYQPQDTEEGVIRGWLTDNDLTWQKGYPSKSECPGEEGELIPEMHDPLLNDPEVLE